MLLVLMLSLLKLTAALGSLLRRDVGSDWIGELGHR